MNCKRITALILLFCLTCAALAGCTNLPPANANAGGSESSGSRPATAGYFGSPLHAIFSDDHVVRTVRVSTAEEFLDAIASNTVIELSPGVYNLTNALDTIWAEDSLSTKRVMHNFGYLRSAWDEPELVIWPITNLTIRGTGNDADSTLLTANWNAATLLTFSHCKNVAIENVTLTTRLALSSVPEDPGTLLSFDTCTNVRIDSVEFVPFCGYEFAATAAEGTYLFTGSRFGSGAADGHLAVTESKAAFLFERCAFEGTAENRFAQNFPTAEMRFSECVFDGRWNVRSWLERDNVLFTACTSGGSPLETDLSARAERFDPTGYWNVTFDETDLNGTKWRGVLIQYTDTAASRALPYTDPDTGAVYSAEISFAEGGTGLFSWYNAPEAGPFGWRMETAINAVFPGVKVELFENTDDPDAVRMLRLWIDNIMIWMAPAD